MHESVPPGDRAMSIDHAAVRLVCRSPAMRGVDDAIDRAARSDAGAVVTGEAGVGRALVARLIHQRSARAHAPMVALTCAGLPDWLLESDLFGHVRGGFTGAWRDKPGMLELAPNGTLFLDEVGELGAGMQTALLRFLESGDVRRLGADRAHLRVDVRVIAASRPDLPSRVAAGAFRGDLHAGLAAIHIAVPPLRERAEDIPLLVESLLRSRCQARGVRELQVSSEAMHALIGYPWPGNVRELRTVAERLVIDVPGSLVRLSDLPPAVRGLSAPGIPPAARPARAWLRQPPGARVSPGGH